MAGSFALDIEKFVKKANGNTRAVIQKFAFEAFSRIVLKTPVDTGRARANWSVSIGRPNLTADPEKFDKSGSATLAGVSAGVGEFSGDGSIFLANNLPYIGVLEYGREDGTPGSRQAPNGMVRVTVEEMVTWAARVK